MKMESQKQNFHLEENLGKLTTCSQLMHNFPTWKCLCLGCCIGVIISLTTKHPKKGGGCVC